MKQTKLIKRILGLSLAAIMATGVMPVTAYAKGYEAASTPFEINKPVLHNLTIEENPENESKIIKITEPCTVVASFECKNAEQAIGGLIPMRMSLNYELLLNDCYETAAYNSNCTPAYSGAPDGDYEYVKYTVTEEDIANAGGEFILYCHARAIMYPQKKLSECGQNYTFNITAYANDKEKLAGYTLSLDGNIGADFYMQLASEIANSETAYMHFTLADGSVQDIPVKEARKETVNDVICYVFRCDVPAKNMTDVITAQIIDKDKAYREYKYTIKEYAEYLLANQDNAEYAEAAPMAKAMLNYGSYAQLHFGYNTDNLANDTVYMTDAERDVSSVTADTLEQFRNQNEQKCDFFRFEGASLDLLSQTTLRLWFTADAKSVGNFTISYYYDDKTITANAVQSGKYYYIDISNISAKDLDCAFIVNFANGDYEWFTWYNVMAYCYNVLSRETTDVRSEQLKDTVRALYLYNQAAKEYFA